MNNFKILNRDLVIEDISTAQVLWRGRPFDSSVVKISPIDGQAHCLVLLDYYEFSQVPHQSTSNLFLIGMDRKVCWYAQLPETSDTFVDYSFENGNLYANTWLGFEVQIDIHTGFILNKKFTK